MEAAEDARSWQDSRANGGHRTEMASGSAFQYSTLATLVETPLPPAPTSFLHPLALSPTPPLPFSSSSPRSSSIRAPSIQRSIFLLLLCALSSLSSCKGRNPLVSVLRSFYFVLRILRFRSLPDFSSPSSILAMSLVFERATMLSREDRKREVLSTVRF